MPVQKMTKDTLLQALQDHFDALNQMVLEGLEANVQPHREALGKFAAGIKALQKTPGEIPADKDAINKKHLFHISNLEICSALCPEISAEIPLTGLLSKMKQEHENFLERIPVRMPLNYPDGYFNTDPKDPLILKIKRSTEWILLAPEQVLRSLWNPFRKLAGKKIPYPLMPVHQVHANQLYKQFLLPIYLDKLAELVQETRKETSRSLSLILEDEFKPHPEFQWKKRYDHLLESFFQANQDDFVHLLNRSGTPLSFIDWKIRFNKGRLKNAFSKIMQLERSWRITLYAFYEDWRFRERLFAFIQEIRLLQLEVTSIFSGRIRSTLYPELEKQKVFITRILELYMMNKEKKQEVQKASADEAVESITGILQKLENVIQEKLQDFPEKVGVVYSPDYIKGIRQSEIRYFSPGEFLEFNSLAGFLQTHKKLKADLGKFLERIVREFREFDQIVDFYLDSAIALTQKPEIGEEGVIQVFRQGLKRLEAISDHGKDLLGTLEQEKWAEISANTEAFIDSVSKLEDNDNILNIYTRILKSKALASSAQNRQRLLSGLKTSTSWVIKFASQHFSWLRSSYEGIRKRLKLSSSSATITSEISNYLAGIRRRMQELPVIYQHLFEEAPVKELNLFLSRQTDTEKLNQALADWEKGNFAATLVSGEAGSGCSSFLQQYARNLKRQYPILSFQLDRFYFSTEDFYSLMAEIFDPANIKDEHSLTEFFSSLTEKIVIIDGLERMFLRKVNGFDCLHRFLSLVVNTNERIFWICSVSKIAYHYLNRTVVLSEHFDYYLDIDNLTASDIREIIMKRNRLSGYNLHFLTAIEDAKQGPQPAQDELEEVFFADLERFAGSNIGLSLIYWLQSVQSVGEEGIQVSQFSVPDFEFLNNLSARKTFVLLLVIMHGKITESYHALVSNCSAEESAALLSLLKEDAILVRKDGYYFLNGILYKHAVKLLRDRNLIH